MSIAIKNDKKYTYEDYLTWNDGKRWEIIDGVAYMMSPSPSNIHQEILLNLGRKFGNHLENKKCKVYPAPFDVLLPNKEELLKKSSSTVQPDITVVCDPEKTKGHGCKGAPDLIIEILSPSTSKHDTIIKYRLYERNAIKEYWIVDPVNQIVERFSYDDGSFKYKQVEYFTREDTITPIIFPDLQIKLKEVFPKIEEEGYED